ncbi:sensor histidine kinase [Microbacterium sp. JZ101]
MAVSGACCGRPGTAAAWQSADMSDGSLSAPQRPRGLGLGLNRIEWALDAAAAIALVVELTREISTGSFSTLPVVVLAAASVAARRRLPIVAASAALLVSGLALLAPAGAVPLWVAAEVCLFSLALRRPRRIALWFGAAHATLLYVGAVVVFRAAPLEPVALILPVWTAAVVSVGLFLRTNDDYVRALEEHSRSAAAYRESEVRHKVDEERLRIARDLHDSVAHTVSAVAIHAGAAERHLTGDTERARTALQQVRASARAVVDELQDVLAVLRNPGDSAEDERGALPGLDGLEALVEATRATGMHVEYSASLPASLDRSVGVATYRIVQESLTNARKHGTDPVTVSIRHDDRTLRIHVVNRLRGTAREDVRGFGLIGMRERAASVHGTLRASAEPHRFVLRATLPLHAHETEGLG